VGKRPTSFARAHSKTSAIQPAAGDAGGALASPVRLASIAQQNRQGQSADDSRGFNAGADNTMSETTRRQLDKAGAKYHYFEAKRMSDFHFDRIVDAMTT